MAFELNNFNNISSGASAGPKMYSYRTTTDSLATVLASGYFANVADAFAAGDLLYLTIELSGPIVVSGVMQVDSATSTTVTWEGSKGPMLEKKTISSAEVLTLRQNPIIVATQSGTDFVSVFDSLALQLDYNSAAYAESADNLVVRYTGGSGVIVSNEIEMTGFIDATENQMIRGIAVKNALVAGATVAGASIYLHNHGDGEFASGDSPLVSNCYFSIVRAV